MKQGLDFTLDRPSSYWKTDCADGRAKTAGYNITPGST